MAKKALMFLGILVACGSWGFVSYWLFRMPMLTGIGAAVIGGIGVVMWSDCKKDGE